MGVPVNIPNDESRLSMAGIENPATEFSPDHWYTGASTALPDSLTQGFAETVGAIDKAGAAFRRGVNATEVGLAGRLFGVSDQEQAQTLQGINSRDFELQAYEDSKKSMDAIRGWSQQQLAPDKVASLPAFVGNFAKGLEIYGMGSLFGGPVAGAVTLGGTTANTTYEDNPDLDPATRLKLSAVNGLTAGAGAFLPGGIGGSLVKRIVSGAAINAGFQATGRLASSVVLDQAGYPDMARQYAPLDLKSITADALLGAAFGALHRAGERPDQATIEQALDDRRQAAISRGAAGLPTSPEGIDVDARLQNQALAAMIKGEVPEISPEDVSTVIDNSVLDPEKLDWHQQVLDAAAREHGLAVDPTPPEIQEGPVGLRAKIEAEGEAAVANPEPALARYAEDPRTAGGKIVSGDLMAEAVSPSVAEHHIEGHGIIAEHGAANRLANDLFESRMAEPIQEEPKLFTGNEPPPAKGFVRLYRAESLTVKFDDVFDRDGLKEFASDKPGVRFTDDLKYAKYFKESYGKDANISYVDVPKKVAETHQINGYEYRLPKNVLEPNKNVLIMVGNAGAGKSRLAELNAEHYHTVLDTNGADPQGLQQSINLALKSGRQVDVLMAHAPLEEVVARNLKRQAAEGRAVRILDQADLAVKAPSSFGQAMDVFGQDPNVSFSVKETTPNGPVHVGPEAQDFIQRLRQENANRNNLETAVRAYTGAKGGANVSPAAQAVFEHGLQEAGVSPEAVAGGNGAQAPGAREAGRGASGASGESAKLDPLIREQAAQLAYAHPDLPVELPDGRTVPAAALETELANSLKQAEQDSGLFDTAISCFLRSLL